jgi:hypothetical protein
MVGGASLPLEESLDTFQPLVLLTTSPGEGNDTDYEAHDEHEHAESAQQRSHSRHSPIFHADIVVHSRLKLARITCRAERPDPAFHDGRSGGDH